MRISFSFMAGAAAALVSLGAAAGVPDIARVPSANGAAFSGAVGAAAGREAVVASGDGARLVACGAALVAAANGSRAVISCEGGPDISLDEGVFRITVGSARARIHVGGAALTAANAELVVAREGSRWLARWSPRADGGSVEMSRDGDPATGAGLSSLEVSGPDAARLDDAARYTLCQAAGAAPFAPRRVELPIAKGGSAGAGASDASDVEVESIEVEVGCIEVCVD
jgi:hypothetical protein